MPKRNPGMFCKWVSPSASAASTARMTRFSGRIFSPGCSQFLIKFSWSTGRHQDTQRPAGGSCHRYSPLLRHRIRPAYPADSMKTYAQARNRKPSGTVFDTSGTPVHGKIRHCPYRHENSQLQQLPHDYMEAQSCRHHGLPMAMPPVTALPLSVHQRPFVLIFQGRRRRNQSICR